MPFPTVHPALERALAAHGYAEPTAVQEAVLADSKNTAVLVQKPQADLIAILRSLEKSIRAAK